MGAAGNTFWSTKQEIDFVRSLGTHNEFSRMSRGRLLECYLLAASMRDDWGKIDQDKVLAEVRALMSE